MTVSSKISSTANVSKRVSFASLTTSGSAAALSNNGDALFKESQGLGHLSLNGKMRAHKIHSFWYDVWATNDAAGNAAIAWRGAFGLTREENPNGNSLRGQTLSQAQCLYEDNIADVKNYAPGLVVGMNSLRCVKRFEKPVIAIQPYYAYCACVVQFANSGNISIFYYAQVEYEPIELSSKLTKQIINATTSIGGSIERRD